MNLQNYTFSLILVLLYAIAWGYAFYKHWKNCNGRFGSGSFILSTYVLYSVCAFFLYTQKASLYGDMHLFQFVYLFCLMLIGLLPVLVYDKSNVVQVIPPPEIVLKVFTILYVISTLLYLPSAVSHIEEGLTILMLDPSGGHQLYLDRLNGGNSVDYRISNILSIFYNIFKDCASLVYFYYLTLPKKKRLVLYVFTFAIFSAIFNSFAEGNRTQATFVVLSIIASYFMFWHQYDEKTKKIARIIGISLFSVSAFLFLTLTFSRHGKFSEGGGEGMLSYIGQAPLNFNEYAFDAGGIRYGDRTINLFKKIVGFDVPTGIFDTRAKYSNMVIGDEIFTTYIGDFVLDFGPWLTPLLVILFTSVILRISRSNGGTIPFYKLIPIHYVMNVCVNGGMYLFCYPFMSNLTIFAYIFFYICCRLFANQKSVS